MAVTTFTHSLCNVVVYYKKKKIVIAIPSLILFSAVILINVTTQRCSFYLNN